MVWMVEDKMPHINFFTSGELRKSKVIAAYKDLTTAYGGIKDFVSILDGISEGIYNLSEVMCAGAIITESLDGYLITGNHWEKAMYIRINGCDNVFLPTSFQILTGEELKQYEFDGNNGIRYKFNKKRSIKKDSQLGRADYLRPYRRPTTKQ